MNIFKVQKKHSVFHLVILSAISKLEITLFKYAKLSGTENDPGVALMCESERLRIGTNWGIVSLRYA